jgi:hypothetical protein
VPLCLQSAEIEVKLEPDEIARAALLALPVGEWDMDAILKTESGDDREDERHLTVQLRYGAGGVREIIYGASSIEDKPEGLRILLSRDGTARLFDPATEKPVTDMRTPLLGSAFSVEDVSLNFLSWKKQELLGTEIVRGRDCWKIASYRPEKSSSAYVRVESWIDQKYRALLQADGFNDKGEKIKEFRVKSFKEFEKVWMLRTLDLNATGAHSRLEIRDAKKVK